MFALFCESGLGIKQSVICLITCFVLIPARNFVNPIIISRDNPPLRGGIEEHQKLFLSYFSRTTYESSSRRDDSNEGSQSMFLWKIWKIIP